MRVKKKNQNQNKACKASIAMNGGRQMFDITSDPYENQASSTFEPPGDNLDI